VKTLFATIFIPVIFLALAVVDVYAVTFTLSNSSSDGEQVTFDVAISGLTSQSCPNTKCYLQAAFTQSGTANYFGFTKGQNDWFKYSSSPDTSYIQSTFFAFEPAEGSWSGQVTVKIDPDDSGYTGPGTYDIKAWRYTGNSTSYSGPSDNTISANLSRPVATATPDPTSIPTPSPTSSPTTVNATPTPTPKTTPKPTTAPAKSATPSASPQVLGENDKSLIASDAGLLDSSTKPQDGFQKSPGKLVAGILVASGTGLILFALGFHLWYRKINKGKIYETKDPFQL